MPTKQLSLFEESFNTPLPEVAAALETLASQGGVEARGAVFTRPEVVDFILDLVGYTEDQPIHRKRLLEPSFGSGDFLLPIVGRLLKAWRRSDRSDHSGSVHLQDTSPLKRHV